MKFKSFLFIVALGGGYAVAHALGASQSWSNGVGWGAAGLAAGFIFVFGRRNAYRAAIRVERYRRAASQLRANDPDGYWHIIAQADGSEAEQAAHRDPDAYVALFMAAASDLPAMQ
jgi:hypothetical protein